MVTSFPSISSNEHKRYMLLPMSHTGSLWAFRKQANLPKVTWLRKWYHLYWMSNALVMNTRWRQGSLKHQETKLSVRLNQKRDTKWEDQDSRKKLSVSFYLVEKKKSICVPFSDIVTELCYLINLYKASSCFLTHSMCHVKDTQKVFPGFKKKKNFNFTL